MSNAGFVSLPREHLKRCVFEIGEAGPQRSAARVYRKLSQVEILVRKSELTEAHGRAALKFEKIYHGAMGVDVRSDDGYTPDPLEYPQAYYAQKLSATKDAFAQPAQFHALRSLIIEDMPLEQVGRCWRGAKKREIARAHGLAVVSLSLDHLVRHWGLV